MSELSTFKLKQIARDMEIPTIPGSAGKRSLIRAILAEQAISQEKVAAQFEQASQRAVASPLGSQLSLFDAKLATQFEQESRPAIAQKQKPALVVSKKRAVASLPGIQLSLFDAVV